METRICSSPVACKQPRANVPVIPSRFPPCISINAPLSPPSSFCASSRHRVSLPLETRETLVDVSSVHSFVRLTLDESRRNTASPNLGELVRPRDKSRALRRLDWARFPRSSLLSKREFGFEFASDPGLSKARLTSEDGEWKGEFVGTKEVGGGGEFMLGNLVEKFGRPLSFRNYHSIVEMGNSRGRERILVNAVGPRAPQGLAKVSAEHFSVNSRQVEIGSIVCAIVGRAREWRMRTAIPARRIDSPRGPRTLLKRG